VIGGLRKPNRLYGAVRPPGLCPLKVARAGVTFDGAAWVLP
jgi:hypothetical protein